METEIKSLIRNSIRKNRDEILALSTLSLPDFVYRSSAELQSDVIPVFCFHQVNAESFEEQLVFLQRNAYRTLSADMLLEIINGGGKSTPNTVVLTIDDGRKDLWTIVYPLLKKYGMTAISFIIPSVIKESSIKSPNLEDLWSRKINSEDLMNKYSSDPFCNWEEITEMHKSGVIDFQSHSMYHASVYSDDKLINFVNPKFKPSILNSTFNPLETFNAEEINLGSPVFRWSPNLASDKRFLPNKLIEKECVDYVNKNGGESFFLDTQWRNELIELYSKSAKKHQEQSGTFQSESLRESDIMNDLSQSKKIIEERLNKRANHLCYPWFRGNLRSVEISKRAGYKGSYWGILNNTSINKPGDDPMHIKRINDYYIFSLPGKGRISLLKQVIKKLR